ncbi:uncharacterized protein BT62DRAFT_1081639 [Guyanagaster necrorhizus]|uniref:Uncharacterized protein n=1 Tax=Guyanagaster necrorhizus TaxID=856835 RepID=A0A9P7VES4_9AGAR|nr:uncharacterized protein BT62DRAFT_1081639 [Guyanagaster necrorhizus MCA 3950]KAG7439374.1 hypothetical protein BT62DRAFT_1081639 [Guyanagaster necrorhizus MCA 3950]
MLGTAFPQPGSPTRISLSSSHSSIMCNSLSPSVMVFLHFRHEASYTSPPSSTSVPMNNGRGASEPQCCHCGWRGAHAPGCPFG